MKVKQVKTVTLTANEGYEIALNGSLKAGDTVAREIVLCVDGEGTVSLADGDGNAVKVINANTYDVESYSGGQALIMADGLGSLVVTSTAADELTYKVLV